MRAGRNKPGYPTLAGAVAAAVLGAGALWGCGPTDGDKLMGDNTGPTLPDAATPPPGPDAGDLMMGGEAAPDLPPDLPPGEVP
jgi:hypothetical protein